VVLADNRLGSDSSESVYIEYMCINMYLLVAMLDDVENYWQCG